MSKRTTIVLAVIAAGMAGFIAFYESGMLTTGELEARRGRVLERFVRARVTDVEIERGDARLVLHRDRDEDLDAFELGHWTLTQPITSEADQDTVDSLLSALEWLESRRSLSGVTDEDRRTFGLAEPRATVRFTAAGEQISLAVGGDDPRGQGVYVAVVGDDRAFIVGSDFLEAIQHDADHFRRKELFTAFRSVDVSAIELRNLESEARLERGQGRWWLRAPWDGLARASTVEELFGLVTDVRATRFLTEGDAAGDGELARYGLAEPSRELTIRRERTDREPVREGDPERDRTPLRLRIGGPCPEHEGELTAIAGDTGPIVCVTAESVATLDAGMDRLRETRLSAMRDDELDRAEFEAGDARFELRRDADVWKVAQGDSVGDADEQSIADWTRVMRAADATTFEPATDEALRARGLDAPRATLTMYRADAERTEILRLGAVDGDGVWVRRGDEPQIARYAAGAEVLIAAPSIHFRARALVHDAEGSLQALRIVRADGEEVLAREGTQWQVTAPVQVAADRVASRDVARALASLTAVRFVAVRAAPEHGLEQPRVVVSATFEGPLPTEDAGEDDHDHDHEEPPPGEPREIVLRVGASTEGGAFARLGDDPAVFVIAPELESALAGPLASRDLLATESSDLETLALVRGGERVELRREADGWATAGGPADEARTTLVLDRLSSMRALGTTAYGTPAPDAGFASPTLVLEIARRRGGEPRTYQIEIGAPGQGGDDGWYHARRSDQPITYRIGAAVVRAFLDYQP